MFELYIGLGVTAFVLYFVQKYIQMITKIFFGNSKE